MALYQFYAYAASALVHNSGTGSFVLRADYDHTRDRILVTLYDDDTKFDGDQNANEEGDDSNQLAMVVKPDGTMVGWGRIYDEAYANLDKPGGGSVKIDRIEIGGAHLGYISSEPLVPGHAYPVRNSQHVTSSNPDTRLSYSQIKSVPCFGPGVHLDTDRGPVPVDWLTKGDRVLTLDNGYQPILWIGRSKISSAELRENPCLRPVMLPAGRFGEDGPARNLVLSPEHRVLIASAQIELLLGTHEVLAACKFLCDADQTPPVPETGVDGFSYHHVLFARHEIVRAEGLWVESFLPAEMALQALDNQMIGQIEAALSDLGGSMSMRAARYVLKKWEARLLGLADWGAPAHLTEGARYGSKIA